MTKILGTLVLCLRSTKKLFKVESMDIITNRSLSLILEQCYLTICVFNIPEHSLFLYDVLNIKKHICRSDSDHIDNSAFKK